MPELKEQPNTKEGAEQGGRYEGVQGSERQASVQRGAEQTIVRDAQSSKDQTHDGALGNVRLDRYELKAQ